MKYDNIKLMAKMNIVNRDFENLIIELAEYGLVDKLSIVKSDNNKNSIYTIEKDVKGFKTYDIIYQTEDAKNLKDKLNINPLSLFDRVVINYTEINKSLYSKIEELIINGELGNILISNSYSENKAVIINKQNDSIKNNLVDLVIYADLDIIDEVESEINYLLNNHSVELSEIGGEKWNYFIN